MRCTMTRVLPEPAPASTRSGPSVCVTACRCSGLSFSRRSSIRASKHALVVVELKPPDRHAAVALPLGAGRSHAGGGAQGARGHQVLADSRMDFSHLLHLVDAGAPDLFLGRVT